MASDYVHSTEVIYNKPEDGEGKKWKWINVISEQDY